MKEKGALEKLITHLEETIKFQREQTKYWQEQAEYHRKDIEYWQEQARYWKNEFKTQWEKDTESNAEQTSKQLLEALKNFKHDSNTSTEQGENREL